MKFAFGNFSNIKKNLASEAISDARSTILETRPYLGHAEIYLREYF